MARIRTIKPEFCTSEQVAECSPNARLLFVLMWMFCDDAGRHPANCKRLKMECFPGDAFTDKQMKSMVDELTNAGLLSEYTFENQAYWQVTGWKHQRIDKPSFKYGPLDKSGFPSPISTDSTTIRRPFDESSPPEGNGRESTGMEGNGVDSICGVAESSATPPEAAKSGFSFLLADGSIWELLAQKMHEYETSFPELDLDQEFRAAGQWLRDNPRRRKTRTGMPTFLGSWLTRSQNKGGASVRQTIKASSAGITYDEKAKLFNPNHGVM